MKRLENQSRRRLLVLAGVMLAVAVGVGGTALRVLYVAAFEQQRERLVDLVKSRAAIIEAVIDYDSAHFDSAHGGEEFPGGAFEASLSQLRDAHERGSGFGETGELFLARREGDWIVFLLRLRHHDKEQPEPIHLSSENAAPMRMALLGGSGTLIGPDYRGETVLAGYEALPELGLGIVAKIDLAEVRAPFLRAGLVLGIVSGLLVLLGLGVFRLVGTPMIREMEESEAAHRTLFAASPVALWEEDFSGVKQHLDGLRVSGVEDLRAHLEANPEEVRACLGLVKVGRVNPAAVEMFQADTEEELIGGFSRVIGAESLGLFRDEILALEEGETAFRSEDFRRTLRGEKLNVVLTLSLVPGGETPWSRVVVAMVDITERKRVEESLRISEQGLALRNRVAQIFLTVEDEGIYPKVLDLVLEATESELGVFGFLDEDGALVVPSMTRDVWKECQLPDKRFVFPREEWGESMWPRALRERRTLLRNETSTLTPKGHLTIHRNIAAPILLRGEPIGLFQVANKPTDYSEEDLRVLGSLVGDIAPILSARLHRDREERARKRAETALKLSEHRFRGTFEQAAVGIAHVATDGRFLRLNQRFAKIVGYTVTEMLELTFQEITHPDDLERDLAFVERLQAGEMDSYSMEKRYIRRNGPLVWVLLTVSLIRSQEGEPDYFVAVIEDISGLKQAQEELEGFAYSVSHDLLAPLRGIDGFSRILVEEYAPELPAEAQRYLSRVRENSKRMGILIDELLTFSRLGRKPISRKTVHPAGLAEDVLGDLRGESDGRKVELTIGDLPDCEADSGMLRQVFANLLGNAFKYTRGREVAKIEVGWVENGDQPEDPVYYVRDNGAGFDMAYSNKLFGVFQRLHGSDEFEGTGVGLATVHRIIHRHGGRIWAEAEVDKGAAFYFTLGGGGVQ